MNISAGAEQAIGGRALVVERDAGCGNSHQRRRAAREKDHKGFVGLKRTGDIERTPSGLLAADRRDRMAADNHLEGRRHVARPGADDPSTVFRVVLSLLKDDKAGANSRSEQTSSGLGHRGRGLAGRDDAQSAVRQRIRSRERALKQTSGCGRTETGADNRHEVLSKS